MGFEPTTFGLWSPLLHRLSNQPRMETGREYSKSAWPKPSLGSPCLLSFSSLYITKIPAAESRYNFTSSLGRLRHKIVPKSVTHAQHDYFSTLNQSNHCKSGLDIKAKKMTFKWWSARVVHTSTKQFISCCGLCENDCEMYKNEKRAKCAKLLFFTSSMKINDSRCKSETRCSKRS